MLCHVNTQQLLTETQTEWGGKKVFYTCVCLFCQKIGSVKGRRGCNHIFQRIATCKQQKQISLTARQWALQMHLPVLSVKVQQTYGRSLAFKHTAVGKGTDRTELARTELPEMAICLIIK